MKPNTSEINIGDRTLYVISDLHLAAGRNATTHNYSGTENFFADDIFCRFLADLAIQAKGHGMLAINGDFIDFLRITNVPRSREQLEEWKLLLEHVQIQMTIDALRRSYDNDTELKYGLKTHEYKSVWKILICSKGHSPVFAALAKWILDGNQLVIIKGNHDLEWYWPGVQDAFRVLISRQIVGAGVDLKEHIRFYQDVLIVNDRVYLEHGHRYENITWSNKVLMPNGTELNLPFGSFMNRYLLNKIEISYPYLDNIRPRTNILPVLIRERFPLALQVLFNYIPFVFKLIPKWEIWNAFKYLLEIVLIIGIPVGITGYAVYETGIFSLDLPSQGIGHWFIGQLKNVFLLVLSYVIGRVLAWAKLREPGSLFKHALDILDNRQGLRIVTFGHTHDPEQKESRGRRYFNTGTWMPVYEIAAAEVRMDLTYSFLRINFEANGEPDTKTTGLYRWNNAMGCQEPMVLIEREEKREQFSMIRRPQKARAS